MRRILPVVLLTVVCIGAAGTGAASAARPTTTTAASEETTTTTAPPEEEPTTTTTAPPEEEPTTTTTAPSSGGAGSGGVPSSTSSSTSSTSSTTSTTTMTSDTTAPSDATTETTQPPSTTTVPPAFFAPSPSEGPAAEELAGQPAPARPRSLQGLVRDSRISSAAELGLTADPEGRPAEPDPLDHLPEHTPMEDDDEAVALEDRDGVPVGASSASGGLSRSQLVVIASGAVAVLALVLAPSGGRRGPRHRERG